MMRSLLCAGICLIAGGWVLAGEPPKYEPPQVAEQAGSTLAPAVLQSGSDAKPATAISGRKKLEALLQSPANLDFGHRQAVTVKEVLDQLHEQHQLSIRFDSPTLTGVLGSDALASPPNPNVANPHTPQITPNQEAKEEPAESSETPQSSLETLLKVEVNIQHVNLKNVSVATALRHTLDGVPTAAPDDDFSGLPIPLTNAMLLDYVVEDDGLLITTRMNALTLKETRVYSIKNLKDCTPEQLAKVIRLSVRPWSWRSRIDELGDQLKAGGARIPPKALEAVINSSFELAAKETGLTVNSESTEEKPAATKDAPNTDAEQMAMVGNAAVNGLVTFVHASLSALEIVHYADPPTGTIQPLPGKLIITQSQAAHREIAELLKQLAEE